MAGGIIINGTAYSWSNITFSLGTLVPIALQTVSKADYGNLIDMQKAYGTGQFPYGRTDGIVKPKDCKLTMGKPDWMNMLNALGGYGMLLVEGYPPLGGTFDLQVNYSSNFTVVQTTDVLRGCRVKEWTDSPQQGSKELLVEVTLDVMGVDPGNPSLSFVPGGGIGFAVGLVP